MADRLDQKRMQAASCLLALEDPHASEEHVLEAIAWIEEHPEHYDLVREAADFSRICDQLRQTGVEWWEPPVSWPVRVGQFLARPSTRWAAAAAMVIVALSIPVMMILAGQFLPGSPQTFSGEYFTAIGKDKEIVLPDDTRVTLGASSGIRVNFDQSSRRIVLTTGEAFFEVSKDARRPFTVQTHDGAVTALGTAFNVHRSPLSTTVTLRTGRVKVETNQSDRGPVAILEPNSQVEIRGAGGLSRVRRVNADEMLSWRHGQYRYDNAPLGGIISDLRRYSHRPIVLGSPSLQDVRYTGVVNLKSRDIEEWIASLQYLGGIRVTIRADAIMLDAAPPVLPDASSAN